MLANPFQQDTQQFATPLCRVQSHGIQEVSCFTGQKRCKYGPTGLGTSTSRLIALLPDPCATQVTTDLPLSLEAGLEESSLQLVARRGPRAAEEVVGRMCTMLMTGLRLGLAAGKVPCRV